MKIAELTKDCPRDDCAISSEGGVTTAMAWFPVYDKRGNEVSGGDPNATTMHYRCHSCGSRWSVRRQRGNETIEKQG